MEPIKAAKIYPIAPESFPKYFRNNSFGVRYNTTLIMMITDSRTGNIFRNIIKPFLIPSNVFFLSNKKDNNKLIKVMEIRMFIYIGSPYYCSVNY